MSVTTSSGDTEIPRMEQEVKRMKLTKESITVDIACSINDITKSVQSISESFNHILKANKAVVTYLQNVEKREKAINLTTEDIERTFVSEKQ